MHHAILDLTDDIWTSFKKGKLTLGGLIDLSKVFDTVNHGILLPKSKLFGIKGKCLNIGNSLYHSVKTKITYTIKLLLVYLRPPFLDHVFPS